MAIIVKQKNPIKLIQAFNCSEAIYEELLKCGGTLKTTTNTIQFLFDGIVIQTVPVKAGALSMATSGTLGSASKEALSYKIKKALAEALTYVKQNGSVKFTSPSKLPKAPSVLPMSEGGLIKNKPLVAGVDFAAHMKDKKIALSNATTMYQPVSSTTGSSVYHVVGLSTDLKVAARYKNTTLSVRVEGNVLKFISELKIAGLNVDPAENGYVSIHLDVGTTVMAKRTLGAILSGIPKLETPMPDLSLICGKGA